MNEPKIPAEAVVIENPPQFSKADFEENARARSLRALCLELIKTINILVYPDLEIEDSDQVLTKARFDLLRLRVELVHLGVEDLSMKGSDAEDMQPKTVEQLAEYAAAKLLNLSDHEIHSQTEIIEMASQYGEERFEEGKGSQLKPKPDLHQYASLQVGLRKIQRLLDIQPDEIGH